MRVPFKPKKKKETVIKNLPKVKPKELMSALLQMTMETDETTERVNAPTVPSWNLSPSPIFCLWPKFKLSTNNPKILQSPYFFPQNEKKKNAEEEVKLT